MSKTKRDAELKGKIYIITAQKIFRMYLREKRNIDSTAY